MARYLSALHHLNRDVRRYILAWALIAFGYFGVRRAFIAGLGLSTLANGLLLLSGSLPASLQTGWLLIWWLPRWLGTALVAVNSTPYLMGITRCSERHYAFAFHQAVMGLAALLGSVFAGILPEIVAAHLGVALDAAATFRTVLWLTPLTYTLAVLVLLGARPVTPPDAPVAAPPVGPKPLGLMAFFGVVVFLQMLGEGTVRGFFNVYLDAGLGVSTVQIGLLMGVGQVLPVLVALVAPLLMVRWGAGQTLSAATLGMALSVLVLALVPSWLGASVTWIGVTAMAALVGPARSVFSQESVRAHWRTAISTATTLGSSLGGSAAGWSGGVLLPALGYPGLFTLGAAFTVVAAGLLQGYLRRAGPCGRTDLDTRVTWTGWAAVQDRLPGFRPKDSGPKFPNEFDDPRYLFKSKEREPCRASPRLASRLHLRSRGWTTVPSSSCGISCVGRSCVKAMRAMMPHATSGTV